MGCNGNSPLRRAWFACETDCGRVLAPYFCICPTAPRIPPIYTFATRISPSLILNCFLLLRTLKLTGLYIITRLDWISSIVVD